MNNSATGMIRANEEQIVELLRSLVRIRSLTGEEDELGKYIAQLCESLGLEVEVLEAEEGRPNVIATWDSGIAGPTLLLNDHLDTFPPGPLTEWKHDPYAADMEGGRIFGRGTVDTKSGVVTLLSAVKYLKASGMELRGKVVLIFSCDEEGGGSRLGIRYLASIGKLSADMALVAEPTTMQVEVGTKGRLVFEVVTRGVAAHGARPWDGHNAITDMACIIRALEELDYRVRERKDGLVGKACINLGTVRGGAMVNMVPSECTLGVERRVLPTESKEDVVDEVESTVRYAAAQRPSARVEVAETLWWPGYLLDQREPVVGALSDAYRRVFGSAPIVTGKEAGTDASWIYTLAGIPVVMFSPGDGALAGKVDESVAVEDLIRATEVVAEFICGALR